MNYQFKFWYMALLLSMAFLTSCSDDDDDSEPTLTVSELLQTTWEACVCDYDAEGKAIVNEEYLIVEYRPNFKISDSNRRNYVVY
ncbi:hypothetical protein [Bacteroides sp.]|uniref:hypothetical protein n=1 Tax=Bacteroides sp. TaxID=29523 RepID=UPI002603FE05|nr:hypothetical protein [Bacteroides sp.]